MDDVFDLFGNPVRPGRGQRGRPPYEPMPEDRNKIKLLLALGKSIPVMANAIGVSPATVKRYFRAELKVRDAMRDRMESAFALQLWRGVQEGNAGAMRLWLAYVERNDRMQVENAFAVQPADKPATERIGKKLIDEQRALDADADLMAELEQEATSQNVH
ncbi:helix-turn-helix domain-containing protein [Bradyrhizobium liaoningense]